MALIDVSELLSDPDFVDDFAVVRSTRTVGTDGRTVDVPGYYYTYGCVQPAKESQLRQLPEADRVGDFISVVTVFQLYALTDSTAPDIVQWNCRNYRVKVTRDWTNYGEGFNEALCELVELTNDGPN